VQQHRRRDVVKAGQTVREGNPFVSPAAGTSVEALIRQHELFDSNGFTHFRQDSPRWNPQFKVFVDYEYFLQCLNQWGREGFGLNEQVLVDYIQSTEGAIGQSSYQDWAEELQVLLSGAYGLTKREVDALSLLAQRWQNKALQHNFIPAFQQ